MPIHDVHIGPFQSVYVGLASGLDSSPLVQLTSLTTSGHRVSTNQPEAFNYVAGNSLQSGPVSITVNLTFINDDDNIWKLANGNFTDAAYQDSASQYEKLMLLLVHPDEDANSSILIPTCYVQKNIATSFEKSAPTVVPLTFYWQALNRFTPPLYFKRTVDELDTILGIRSPF